MVFVITEHEWKEACVFRDRPTNQAWIYLRTKDFWKHADSVSFNKVTLIVLTGQIF